MAEKKEKGDRKSVFVTEDLSEVGDQVAVIGAGAAILVATPLLALASRNEKRKKQIKRKIEELKKYQADFADKFPIIMRIFTYFHIVFGIFLA